jgi:hypothetical protein
VLSVFCGPVEPKSQKDPQQQKIQTCWLALADRPRYSSGPDHIFILAPVVLPSMPGRTVWATS